MSYILDALKKAESERQLGALPNVYAPASIEASFTDESRWKKSLPWLLLALMSGILLLGLVWLQPWRAQTTMPAFAEPATRPIAATPQPSPATNPSEVAQPVTADIKQPEDSAADAPLATTPALPQAPKMPMPSRKVSSPTPPLIATPKKTDNASAKDNASANSKTEKSGDQSVGTLRDLPQYLQAEVPPVSVAGYIYAKNPADREVLLNQKLLHEGEQIAPNLMLETLLPKGAILNYKGYRYRVAF